MLKSSQLRTAVARRLKQALLARGGGTPLYNPNRYVSPHRVGFFRRFSLKTGTHFAHFGLESGMVFEETTEFQFQMSEKKKREKYANSKWIE